MDNSEARLIGCFQLVFPDLQENEIRQATATSVGAWDSMATVTLIGLVEEEFGIQFDIEEVEDMVSFDYFLRHLRAPAT